MTKLLFRAFSLLTILGALPISAESIFPRGGSDGPYKPEDFEYKRPAWLDDDHDCKSTRVEVILRDCLQVALSANGCKPLQAFDCADPYSGTLLSTDTPSQAIQIDHIYPAHEAWLRRSWTPESFSVFFNDQRNLLAVRARNNLRKGDKMPDEWCPVNAAMRPVLAKKVRRIARDYKLPLNPREESGLRAWEAGRCLPGSIIVGVDQ